MSLPFWGSPCLPRDVSLRPGLRWARMGQKGGPQWLWCRNNVRRGHFCGSCAFPAKAALPGAGHPPGSVPLSPVSSPKPRPPSRPVMAGNPHVHSGQANLPQKALHWRQEGPGRARFLVPGDPASSEPAAASNWGRSSCSGFLTAQASP